MATAFLKDRSGLSGPVIFISNMNNDPWGGSEELWYETALELRSQGLEVGASVKRWPSPHQKIEKLNAAGVELHRRRDDRAVLERVLRRVAGRSRLPTAFGLESWLRRCRPQLIVMNSQFFLPEPGYTEMFLRNGWRYIIVCHSNAESWWPRPEDAALYQRGIEGAERAYFVSKGNWKLARKQIAFSESNVGIIRNPYGVPYAQEVSWPQRPATECLEMAAVGRLAFSSKGQDLLVETLSSSVWRGREWRLNVYGDGNDKATLIRLIKAAGLEDRILLKGHRPVGDIWQSNHLLVMPSRAEGLPIVIVEAMMAGRPVVATDVAGNVELFEDCVSGFVADSPTAKHVGEALERAWASRARLSEMGAAAYSKIRTQVPANPAKAFADLITQTLAG